MQRLAVLLLVVAPACAPRSKWAAVDLYGPPAVAPGAYEHYLRGRLASVEGRHDEAIAEFRRAASESPDQLEPRIAIAEELLRLGRRDDAADEVAEILKRWPRDPAGWLVAGSIHSYGVELGKAAAAFERAIELGPHDETGYLRAATTYKQLGQRGRAEKLYRRLVKRVPSSVEGHYRLGQMLMVARKLPEAERFLAEAVALDPDHIEARVVLSEVFRQSNRPQLASQMLRDAFDRSGEDAEVGQRLVDVLLEGGDREGAIHLLGVLDADWRSARTRVDIGFIYLRIRRAQEAIKTADEVLARDPTYQSARVLKARGLGLAKRRGEAVVVALEVPPDSSEHPEARAYAGEILARDGKLAEAMRIVEDALKEHPANPTLVVQQAALHEKKGDLSRARAILDQALRRDPEDEDVRFARASFEDRVGDPERAIEIMWPLHVADPDNVLALNFIGYSYAQRRVKLADSERMLRRAVELRPEDGYVLDSLGLLLLHQGKLDEALTVLERADRLAPEEPEVLLHLGEVLVARGERLRARDLFHRGLGLDPDERVRARLEERVRTLEAQAKP